MHQHVFIIGMHFFLVSDKLIETSVCFFINSLNKDVNESLEQGARFSFILLLHLIFLPNNHYNKLNAVFYLEDLCVCRTNKVIKPLPLTV